MKIGQTMISVEINKRGYNLQEAMHYLGVKRKAFDKYYRPHLTSMPFGTSIIFDVLDLDGVMNNYKHGNERLISKGETEWAENKVESTKTTKIDGASIKYTVAKDFESVSKALKKRKTG